MKILGSRQIKHHLSRWPPNNLLFRQVGMQTFKNIKLWMLCNLNHPSVLLGFCSFQELPCSSWKCTRLFSRGYLCVLKLQLRAIYPSKRARELTFCQGYSDKVCMNTKWGGDILANGRYSLGKRKIYPLYQDYSLPGFRYLDWHSPHGHGGPTVFLQQANRGCIG